MELFRTHRTAPGVTRITDICNVYSYLVEGEDKALLIDTGIGIGNLREFVGTLTPKPVLVVNTHGHPDHCGGNFDFEEAYVSPVDIPLIEPMATVAWRKNYLSYIETLNGTSLEVGEPPMTPPRPLKYHPVGDGDMFDLGGRSLEVVEAPGHTTGSIVLLDRQNRLLFAGDACNNSTYLFKEESTTLETYLRTLRKLQALSAAFDGLHICHLHTPLDNRCIDDLIELCQGILAGENKGVEVPFVIPSNPQHEVRIATGCDRWGVRQDGGIGNVLYDPRRLYDSASK